jgi:hypothetical protein
MPIVQSNKPPTKDFLNACTRRGRIIANEALNITVPHGLLGTFVGHNCVGLHDDVRLLGFGDDKAATFGQVVGVRVDKEALVDLEVEEFVGNDATCGGGLSPLVLPLYTPLSRSLIILRGNVTPCDSIVLTYWFFI